MKKMSWIFGLFCLLVVVQIAAPVSLIVKHENTLRHGEQYKFKTEPVDPCHAIRGGFVALKFDEKKALIPEDLYRKGQTLRMGQKVYVIMEEDENGFAKFTSLSLTRPQEKPYIKAKIHHTEAKYAVLNMPFRRYYMEEKMAPEVERLYQMESKEEKHEAYVTVRVKSGNAVLEELYIDGMPIKEFLLNKKP